MEFAAFKRALEGVVMLLLLATGIGLSVRGKFFQLTHFGSILKRTLGSAFQKTNRPSSGFTPFQALTTALAGSVGTGNVAGVAGAIVLGGPGAVFWMLVSALFGMMTKFVEVTLAVRYRTRNGRGERVGGPMYYITACMKRRWHFLAYAFSLFGMLASFGVGNMTQVNTVAVTVVDAARTFSGAAFVGAEETGLRLAFGIVLAAMTAVVIIGGVRRIGAVTEKLIPFMSVAFVIVSLAVVACNFDRLGGVVTSIVKGAFEGFRPAVGGAVGFSMREALRMGVSRGVFSNEAGLGSAPIAHASAETRHPVEQGMYGVMEVFIDTVVMCTLTGLTLLCAGIELPYGSADAAGSVLMVRALGTVFGPGFSGAFVAVSLLFFAFSTLIGWSLYGVRCAEFLFGDGAAFWYRLVFVVLIVAGALADVGFVWSLADLLNACMAIPNLIALTALSGTVFSLIRQHQKRSKLSGRF
ncbi:MAG: alanine/glycine:cation symporter family protein [Bacillota bacterium]